MMQSATMMIIYAVILEVLITMPLVLFVVSTKFKNAGIVLAIACIALLILSMTQLWIYPGFRIFRGYLALLVDPFTLYFFLMFIASLAGYIRFRAREKKIEMSAPLEKTVGGRTLAGVNGWLLLVVLYFVYIAPLVAIHSVYHPYWVVLFTWVGPNVDSSVRWPFIFITCLVIGYALYVAFALWSRKPKAPVTALKFLVVALLIGAVSPYIWLLDDYAMSLTPPPGPYYLSVRQVLPYLAFEALALNFGIGVVIGLYFKLSKKVRATYSS